MKNLKNKNKLLIVLLIISFIIAIFAKIVIGATSGMIYELGLPRGGNQGTDWGYSAKNLMNGWKLTEVSAYTVRSIDDYNSKTVYCIEPRS